MKIHENFISIVALGFFNPAILNPEFFKKHCISYCDLTNIKCRTTPIASSLIYKNIELSVELGRYQIVERDIRNTKKTNILECFLCYFKTLKYTPIQKIGVNFNSKITGVNKSIIDSLNNAENLRKVLKSESLTYTTKTKVSKSDYREIFWELNYKLKEDYRITISLTLNNSDLDINHNFEFSNIADYKIIYEINRKYNSLDKKNNDFKKYLMKGV